MYCSSFQVLLTPPGCLAQGKPQEQPRDIARQRFGIFLSISKTFDVFCCLTGGQQGPTQLEEPQQWLSGPFVGACFNRPSGSTDDINWIFINRSRHMHPHSSPKKCLHLEPNPSPGNSVIQLRVPEPMFTAESSLQKCSFFSLHLNILLQ